MSTSSSQGLQELKRLADALQQARVDRRTFLRASAAAATTLARTGRPATTAPTQALDRNAILAQGLAPGAALVTSLRLPLPGIGTNQAAPLLQGDITNWYEVGCPIPLPVTLFVVDGLMPEGVAAHEVVADFDALAERFDQTPGGLAMVPTDMIDSRVNTLDVEGISPLLGLHREDAPITRIGVAGDIIFGRNGGNYQRKYGDYLFPMYQVKDFMATFDLTIANFECFVSETIEPPELTQSNPLDFVTVPDSLQGMVMAGIDSVTMANNHAYYPFGEAAMNDTIMYLDEVGIPSWGVGQDLDEARAPWTTEINGLSIACYGVDAVTANVDYPGTWSLESDSAATASKGGTNPLVMDNILADIEALAGQYDIVLPYMHAGEQYLWTPRTWLVDVSRQIIDAGASAMLTSHPHATMGMEIYNGKPIFYSLGNFVYDQMFSLETREGYFVELTFHGKECIGLRLHPTEVIDFVQPRFMGSAQRAGFMDRFWRSVDLTRAQLG